MLVCLGACFGFSFHSATKFIQPCMRGGRIPFRPVRPTPLRPRARRPASHCRRDPTVPATHTSHTDARLAHTHTPPPPPERRPTRSATLPAQPLASRPSRPSSPCPSPASRGRSWPSPASAGTQTRWPCGSTRWRGTSDGAEALGGPVSPDLRVLWATLGIRWLSSSEAEPERGLRVRPCLRCAPTRPSRCHYAARGRAGRGGLPVLAAIARAVVSVGTGRRSGLRPPGLPPPVACCCVAALGFYCVLEEHSAMPCSSCMADIPGRRIER